MKKSLYAGAAVAALVIASPALAQETTVHGGSLLASVVEWGATAFGTAIAALVTAVTYRGLSLLGVQVTDAQKSQLQAVVVNGINSAAAKAETQLRGDGSLDVNVKSQIVSDAVKYTQDHAADLIKSLGLDPNSGQAVEAIRARVATALADPN